MAIHKAYAKKDSLNIGTMITAEITAVLQQWASEMKADLKVGSLKKVIRDSPRERRNNRKIASKC